MYGVCLCASLLFGFTVYPPFCTVRVLPQAVSSGVGRCALCMRSAAERTRGVCVCVMLCSMVTTCHHSGCVPVLHAAAVDVLGTCAATACCLPAIPDACSCIKCSLRLLACPLRILQAGAGSVVCVLTGPAHAQVRSVRVDLRSGHIRPAAVSTPSNLVLCVSGGVLADPLAVALPLTAAAACCVRVVVAACIMCLLLFVLRQTT